MQLIQVTYGLIDIFISLNNIQEQTVSAANHRVYCAFVAVVRSAESQQLSQLSQQIFST